MKLLGDVLEDFGCRFGNRWSVPEYRQIELYTKKKKLAFSGFDQDASDIYQAKGTLSTSVAFMLLDNFLASQDPSLMEGKTSWQKYLSLPRKTNIEKLVAEVYRILRIVKIAMSHKDGLMEVRDGLIRVSCVFERCSLSLNITRAGLALLESFVFYYLDSFRQPYGIAYIEAMLMQYFTDIVAEVKKFSDEDRVLYQFRQAQPFNRHFRFDCDNPKYTQQDDFLIFDIGDIYSDCARYPIDFFLMAEGILHIVPAEALTNKKILLVELSQWKARISNNMELPIHFRTRFGRETMIAGLPMT
jgi:hypothetical protein